MKTLPEIYTKSSILPFEEFVDYNILLTNKLKKLLHPIFFLLNAYTYKFLGSCRTKQRLIIITTAPSMNELGCHK